MMGFKAGREMIIPHPCIKFYTKILTSLDQQQLKSPAQ